MLGCNKRFRFGKGEALRGACMPAERKGLAGGGWRGFGRRMGRVECEVCDDL